MFKDNWKGNKSKDIQIQCKSSPTMYIGGGTGGARGAIAPPFFNMGRQSI